MVHVKEGEKKVSLSESLFRLQKNMKELDQIAQECVQFVKTEEDFLDIQIVDGVYHLT